MKALLFLLISLTLVSCTAYQYVSSPQFVPLNDKKDELKINLSPSTFQIGYSVFDHFSFFTTGFARSVSSSSSLFSKENGGNYYTANNIYEINFGTSYFNKISAFNYEVLAGGGFGYVKYENNRDLDYDYKYTLNSDKLDFFIQPNIGFKVKDVLELGVCSRFSYHNYYNIYSTRILGSTDVIEPEDRYFDHLTTLDLLFWEPGFSLKVGLKKVKFIMLISHVENLTFNQIKYRQENLRLGIFINLDLLNEN